ncbi:MAG TPA: tRNA (adenosine(37)-N6)-threonylcarbamoyltransferase complex ATPase subunit type 1 TsaE [Syntrophobacteraceae bacterium]|nr:tRNA (adenosine(37)-N6)-threonylcarbamoyltransferase complex ATPase subunit type 1 TsaE [Syntrophobacteraceae bacterium]
MLEWVFHSTSEKASLELGRRIGERLEAGDVVALWGELGAGKTLMARGIARGLGIPSEVPITSPTFTIINEYESRLHLYHMDLYRIVNEDDLETIPWRDALYGSGVAVVEWPERLGEALPEQRLDLCLETAGDTARTITIRAWGQPYRTRFESTSLRFDNTDL